MPSSSSQQAELRVKLTWVVVFRAIAISLLLVATAARVVSDSAAGGEGLSPADSLSFVVIGAVYLLTLIYGVLLRQGLGATQRAALAQVIGDVLLASALVYLTGGADSPFVFTYSLAVVATAILLMRRWAFITAAVTSASFTALALVVQFGYLRPPTGSETLPPSRLLFALASNTLSQFLIAALAGYLAEQLSRTGGRLSEREADLKELVALQNRIVNAMPSGLLSCDAAGQITFVNPAARAILSLAERADRPRRIDEVIPGATRLKANARRAELTVETPGGRKTLGLAVTPLDESGTAMLIVFQDLTDLRRLQGELTRIDHLASLGRLSAQLAHEIRNPLASMRGSAQLLADDLVGDKNARLAQIIMRESDRLARLVESYLDLARPPPPSAVRIRIDAVASETVEMLRADPMANGVVIEDVLAAVEGLADAGQLRQVLINLLRNALVAVDRSGTVRVHVEDAGGRARIRVWDSAGSIAPEDVGRIFEPFYSTHQGGTGLGLSTVHSIVKAHGGVIEVSSSPAAGTTFTVLLPKGAER